MTIHATIADIFDRPLGRYEALPLDDELELISRAKDHDEEATVTLLQQYAQGLRRLAKLEYTRAKGHVDREETRANVLVAFMEAVEAAKPGQRLAAYLAGEALNAARAYHLIGDVTIPARTRQRYYQARREALAAGVAPVERAAQLGMDAETFHAVAHALDSTSLDETLDSDTRGDRADRLHAATAIASERGYATVEQKHDAARALAAVDSRTEDVLRAAYGFNDYEPTPDAQIAHDLGMTRPTVQRVRQAGLLTAHDALCPTAEEVIDARCQRGERHVVAEAEALIEAVAA